MGNFKNVISSLASLREAGWQFKRRFNRRVVWILQNNGFSRPEALRIASDPRIRTFSGKLKRGTRLFQAGVGANAVNELKAAGFLVKENPRSSPTWLTFNPIPVLVSNSSLPRISHRANLCHTQNVFMDGSISGGAKDKVSGGAGGIRADNTTKFVGTKLTPEELIALVEGLELQQNTYTVTLFSGGTGSNSLSCAMANEEGVTLNILLNAYDDGKSTGKIRQDFGMLGPSDIAKNIAILLDMTRRGAAVTKAFLDMRLPKDESPKELFESLRRIVKREPNKDSLLEIAFYQLEPEIQEKFRFYLNKFCSRAIANAKRKGLEIYDLRDFGVRNLIFAGAFFANRSYYKAIEELTSLLNVRANILLNNTRSLWLVGITENGHFLNSESAIVDQFLEQDISELFLLAKPLSRDEAVALNGLQTHEEKEAFLQERSIRLLLSRRSALSMATSDVLVFAPTTYHSSLAPTIMTEGFSEGYQRNDALKVFVLNLVHERGKKTASEQLLAMESLFQRRLGPRTFVHDLLDYVIVNTHGYKTDVHGGTTHIPIDIAELEKYGLSVIKVDIEDAGKPGHHVGDKLSRLILALKKMDDLGYRYVNGMLVPKKDMTGPVQKDREILRNLLANPLEYDLNRRRIHALCNRVLGIKESENFRGRDPVRVIIAAAGHSTRFVADYPKVLHPINGQSALSHLVRRVSTLDGEFLVLTNRDNDSPIREELLQMGIAPRTVIGLPEGTGSSILVAEDRIDPSIKNVMIIWGDATNIQLGTMQETLLIHETLGDSAVTMPTCWEGNPYAGIERDSDGNVTGIFQTKVKPETRRAFGEHDASLFVIKRAELFPALKKLKATLVPGEECDFLHTFPLMIAQGKSVTAFAGADPRETQGFNTLEEVERVASNQLELEQGVKSQLSYAEELEQRRIQLAVAQVQISPTTDSNLAAVMRERFKKDIEQEYHAAIFDVDENLTDLSGNIPDRIIDQLIDLARRKIPVAFISGRLEKSLNRMLLSKIRAKVGKEIRVIDYFYAYPVGGALGFKLSLPGQRFYERKFPKYLSSFAMGIIRQYLLGFEDLYHVTDHKITIWPHQKPEQPALVKLINELLRVAKIPLTARISSSIDTDAAIIITSSESGSEVHKGIGLSDFSERTGIPIDQIVKIADRGIKGGVDHELLVGNGSFSSRDFDSTSECQIALPLLSGKSNLEAVEWLLPQIKFRSVIV